MSFERFTENGRSFKPKLSITKAGIIALNNACLVKFNLSEYKYVVLFYDQSSKRIGIKPTNDAKEDGCCKLRVRASGVDISATAYLRYYDLEHDVTTRYSIAWDKESDMLVSGPISK